MPLSPIDLLSMRKGHFALESGLHGDLWIDLELLFTRPARLQAFVHELGKRLLQYAPDAFCGPATGGAFVAQALAQTCDLEFFWAEPRPTAAGVSYEVAPALRPQIAGKRIAIVDDVINAGSAVRSTQDDLRRGGSVCVAIGAFVSLGSGAAAAAQDMQLPLETLAHLPNALWSPLDCPFCKLGVPLDP